MKTQGPLQLRWRPYRFDLPRSLITSRGDLVQRRGWLLRLMTPDGCCGWGEAAEPLFAALDVDLAEAVAAVPALVERGVLERLLPLLPPALACSLGMALAELDGLGSQEQGGWRSAPASAWLLPAGEAAVPALGQVLSRAPSHPAQPLTLKWKVAAMGDAQERSVLEVLLQRLPPAARLRLDANGGWDRPTAAQWADRLKGEPRFEWLEQPLAPHDLQGLEALAAMVPVALDESLPHLSGQQCSAWSSWLVRRPLQEGDPRPLLSQLEAGIPRQMLSTAFETGIGRRFLEHLAALQANGPTPAAPGLAPGWSPMGDLFAAEPQQVWEAAA
jgi:O-succinylbenzoate synthase